MGGGEGRSIGVAGWQGYGCSGEGQWRGAVKRGSGGIGLVFSSPFFSKTADAGNGTFTLQTDGLWIFHEFLKRFCQSVFDNRKIFLPEAKQKKISEMK